MATGRTKANTDRKSRSPRVSPMATERNMGLKQNVRRTSNVDDLINKREERSLRDVLNAKRNSDVERAPESGQRKSSGSSGSRSTHVKLSRPATPSLYLTNDATTNFSGAKEKRHNILEEEYEQEGHVIEVKPLPKIRLSLMPSPREADEYNT